MSPSADTGRGVQSATIGSADAFGAEHWLLTFLPASLLVAVSELSIPGAGPASILLSAVMQHLAAGVLGLPFALLTRARGAGIGAGAAFAAWAVIGAARGATGAGVAAAYGLDPQVAPRLALWVAVGVLWTPLIGHLGTQVRSRQALLRALTEAQAARDDASSRSGRSAQEVRSELLYSITRAVFPAVREIRESLGRVALPDAAALIGIGERLTLITAQVGRTVDRVAELVPVPVGRPLAAPGPLVAALHFEWRRPLQWAGFSGGAALAIAVPLALLVSRPGSVPSITIAVIAGASVLALGPGAVRRVDPDPRPLLPTRYLLGSATACVGVLAFDAGGLDARTALLAGLVAVCLVCTAALFSVAVGTANANRALLGTIGLAEADRARFAALAEEEEDRVRAGLRNVLHGPIQGRLAACAMAINFHAAGSVPSEAETLLRAVLDHLDLVEQDLAALEGEVLAAPAAFPGSRGP